MCTAIKKNDVLYNSNITQYMDALNASRLANRFSFKGSTLTDFNPGQFKICLKKLAPQVDLCTPLNAFPSHM